jgi:hypothetical protein
MAIPLFGGMVAQLVSLWVVPAGYGAIETWKWRRRQQPRWRSVRSAPRRVRARGEYVVLSQ